MVYTAVFPPNSAPDERIHFAATYKNSSYVLNTPAKNEDGKVIYYQSDNSLNNKLGNIPNKAGYQTVFNHLLELRPDDDSQGFSPYSGVGIHSLLAYIPQTVGLVAGRLLHLGWIPLITLGRLTGLIFYAVVCRCV